MLTFEWLVLGVSFILILLATNGSRLGINFHPVVYFFLALAGWGIIGWIQEGLNLSGSSRTDSSILIGLGVVLWKGIEMRAQSTPLFKGLVLLFIPCVAISYLIPTPPGQLMRSLLLLVFTVIGLSFLAKKNREKTL